MRFQCKPVDVSLGGAFLRTRDLEPFRAGDLVSVVFAREAGWPDPVYLFARIARLQDTPAGIGLAWERAVTAGDPAYLADFLNTTLGLKTHVTLAHAQATTGRFRSLFLFDLVHRLGEQHRRKATEQPAAREGAAVAPQAARDDAVKSPRVGRARVAAPTAAAPRATRSIVSRLADSRGVAQHGVVGTNPFEEWTPASEIGALTDEVRSTEQPLPTRIAATLDIDGRAYAATISLLGPSRLKVVAVVAPDHVPGTLRLTAELPVQEGPRAIVAQCAVHGFQRDAEGTTYDLAIGTLDEADAPGVLTRFVKHLYFQTLASTDETPRH